MHCCARYIKPRRVGVGFRFEFSFILHQLKIVCWVLWYLAGQAAWAQMPVSNNQGGAAVAIGLEAQSLKLVPNLAGAAWDLHANFKVGLPPNVIALAQSVPLYFVLDWSIDRPRWYWRDEHLAQGQVYWRLSHNTLTQQWRISTATTTAMSEGRFALAFNSLSEALGSLRRIRREGLVKLTDLNLNQTYELNARLRLDTTLLPKPFQINAFNAINGFNNSDWALDSGPLQATVSGTPPVSPTRP